MPHFYNICAVLFLALWLGSVNALSGLCLISTYGVAGVIWSYDYGVNALSGLCLISTWEKELIWKELIVSMPSRAYASFLHKK